MTPGESRLKSQIFRKLFSSYVIIISIFYLLYSGLAVYESYIINQERIRRENQIKAQEAVSVLEQRLMAAENLVSRINTSSAINKLYTNVLDSSKVLDSYTLYQIVSDLARISTSSGRLDVDDVVIFIDNYDKAYSATGVVHLEENYSHSLKNLPALEGNTIQNALNTNAGGRLTFLKSNLLYMDDYTYSNGRSRGAVCISFDLDALKWDMEKILGEDGGYRILWKDNIVYDNTRMAFKGETYELDSHISDKLHASFQMPKSAGVSNSGIILWILLLAGFAVSAGFIVLAYYFTKKYYEPFYDIEYMIGMEGQSSDNETERILNGLENLIGERNGYRERMVTIAPYANTGMLHGVLTGNMEQEAITVLCQKEYLDLKKPYFVVMLINFAYKTVDVDMKQHKKKMKEIFTKAVSIFSTEETRFFYYMKDSLNVYLVANSDNNGLMDELIYQIHKFMTEELGDDSCLVTFGVDEVRDNLGELRDACDGAAKALENMVLNGRGEVYFYEQETEPSGTNYYFPKNASATIVKYLKEKNIDAVKEFLNDIYTRNLERSKTTAISVEGLVDELHVMTLRSIKQLNERNTTYINVNRISTITTLEEIFDYYMAVYTAVMKELQKDNNLNSEELDDSILSHIRENFANEELSLQYLTSRFGVSSKYISLLCKNEFGMTYLQYIQKQRINYAVELLKTTDYTLEKIGEMCGYASTLTFRRNFKMITGVNPSDYRGR